MITWRASFLLPAFALVACGGPPPKAQVATTDGQAIAEICGVPKSMFAGGKRDPIVTLRKDLSETQLRCTLREVRRLLPTARIIEAGAATQAPGSAANSAPNSASSPR